jgi:MarR family transcriptional regulator for hemolysin
MPPPSQTPIGLHLAQAAKIVSRAFDDALAESGGSTPIWLILISLKTRKLANQRELADAVGIRGATLTHHLNAMEKDGLVTRRRDPANRRVHLVELTDEGEAMFHQLRAAAAGFDERLRRDITAEDLAHLRRVLDQLRENVGDGAAELDES